MQNSVRREDPGVKWFVVERAMPGVIVESVEEGILPPN
jgi:hypothetical protein